MLTRPRTLGARCPRLHQRAPDGTANAPIHGCSIYGAQVYEKSVWQATVSSAGKPMVILACPMCGPTLSWCSLSQIAPARDSWYNFTFYREKLP